MGSVTGGVSRPPPSGGFVQRSRRMRRFHRSVAKVKMWRSPSDQRERRAYAVLGEGAPQIV